MRRAAIWGACALCVVGVSTLFAEGYDDSSSSGGLSGRDYDSSRYDRGNDQSSWSSGQNRSDMYSSDRNRDRSDIYSSDRNRDQSWSGQRGTDQSWRSGTSGQSQYGRDYNARYGYRGEADTGEEWTTGRGGMQQGMGQQWRERGGQEFGQDQGFMEQGMGRRGQGVAVIGRLTREDAQLSGVNPDHKLVQIQTRQGNTLYVDLGPSEEAQNLNLSQNQSIFVHGHLATISGQRVLMARQVGRVSNLTTIDRSQEGFSKGQQRGRDIYGYQGEKTPGGQSKFGQSGQFKSQDQNKSFQSGSSSGMSGQSGSSQFGQPGASGESNLNQSDQSGSSSFGSSSSGQSSGSSDQFQTAPGGSGQSSGSGQSNTGSSSGSNR